MKYNRIFKYLFVILIMAMVSACVKDKPVPLKNECNEIIPNFPDGGIIITYSSGRFQYKTPFFNPNNANEFVYHYQDRQTEEYQLIKYNLLTREKTVITNSGKVANQPKWSRMGWIAYGHKVSYVDHIYTVKDNGDSLQQFTEDVANYYPTWNSSGSELLWQYSANLAVPYYLLRQDLHQISPVDTLLGEPGSSDGFSRFNDVSFENVLVAQRISFLSISSLNDSVLEFRNVINFRSKFNYPEPSGLCWSHDGTQLYTTIYAGDFSGLNRIDLNGNHERLIQTCFSKRYEAISCSPDGKYLVAERVETTLSTSGTSTYTVNSFISLIDLATLEEIKVDLE